MNIAGAAFVLMLGNLASRLLGLVREQVIAGLFGASAITDAFTAASRVPLTLYDLLIGGIISAALVPVFAESALEDGVSFRRLVSSALNLALLAAAALLVPIIWLAPWWMGAFVPGFDEPTRALAVRLVQWMLPALLFMVGAGVLAGASYAQQRFLRPAAALASYNAGIILGALALHRLLGVGALVVGVLLGAVGQFVILAQGLGSGYALDLNLRLEPMRRIGLLALPVFAGLVVSTIGVAIDTYLASGTGEGSLAALRFATTLVQLPLGLVASAVGLAVLPALSRSAALGGALGVGDDYRRTLALGIRLVLLLVLPATAFLVALRDPVVRLLFQHGAFTAGDTLRTANAFLAYAPGLPAAALDQLFIYAFYARKNTLTPVLVGVAAVGVYLVVALLLLPRWGYLALAAANSAQWVGHAVVLGLLLWRAVGALPGLGRVALVGVAASLVLGLGLAVGSGVSGLTDAEGTLPLAVGLAVAAGLSLAGYVALLAALRVPELGMVAGAFRRRVRGA